MRCGDRHRFGTQRTRFGANETPAAQTAGKIGDSDGWRGLPSLKRHHARSQSSPHLICMQLVLPNLRDRYLYITIDLVRRSADRWVDGKKGRA